MNEVLYEVLKVVVTLAVTLIVRFAVPYIKAKMDEANLTWLADWVKTAVYAAEQTITESGSGAERKKMVLEFLQGVLAKTSMKISDTQLNNLIESAVFSMKNGGNS